MKSFLIDVGFRLAVCVATAALLRFTLGAPVWAAIGLGLVYSGTCVSDRAA